MKVNVVIVDSGPVIKGAILENFSKHAISVPGVLKEIKDVKTRERIRNLPPYFFSIRSPSEEAIKHVMNVSKKTGDIKVLSKVDIEVLALAYEMQYLKTEDQVELMFDKMNLDSDIDSDNEDDNDLKAAPCTDHFGDNSDSDSLESIEVSDSDEEEVEDDVAEDGESEENDEICASNGEIFEDNLAETTYETSLCDDDSGWITTDNFDEMKSNNFGLDACAAEQLSLDQLSEQPTIGCLTTDYAMQNVLLHMNIHILSVDGMVVKEPRIFVAWCRSCFKKFKKTDLFFCPSCGNDTIGKIPAKIKDSGEIELFFRKNFQPNLRNTKFSIPTPKGGKHRDGTSYVYCADQRLPHERAKKNKWTFDVNETGNLPFMTHEVTAKSSILGISQGSGARNQGLRPTRPRGNKCSRLKK